ncbi:uncharacterized protein LAESUDRAFT_648565 [Laetiporus sulphureus 93-53]|uniref:PEHE domain-containing protein n=1 Tax=Laetiporus sulphureus 93-53 TaxID=1314785 RepID=A0A165FBJ6_9APHY|nr:uncharacterized protein LAESUDRAFT_648565 [Laetiporus sulphureus 93-53]KZT08718.1 hypothetical protein LAESUDRAFT_648565 [Laetiporus sulphureus 93-53]
MPISAGAPGLSTAGERDIRDNSLAFISTLRSSEVAEDVVRSPGPSNGELTKASVLTRSKRVLPSRSRRGGPGVGNCDTDVMIIETMKRRLESEPLIPAETNFLLTTNSALVPSTAVTIPSEVEINTQAYGRYFDRPEVQKAYRQQQVIQTPEFKQLDEDAHVGGRFRPRGIEDDSADTSDAAYEKRHRKYETFEKRQRLREKEKLKHEQYKLKERIEQLRAMDTTAFLSLPAFDFPPPSDSDVHFDPEDAPGFAEMAGVQIHGTAAYLEGERRRKAMLDVALSLEERYRTLLPPDRKWLEKKMNNRDNAAASAEPEHISEEPSEEESEEEEEEVDELIESEEEQVKPPPAPYHDSDGESEVDLEERDRQRSKGLKLRIKFPPRTASQLKDALAKQTTKKKKQMTLSSFMAKNGIGGGKNIILHPPPSRTSATSSIVPASPTPSRIRASDGRFLANGASASASVKIPPRKRQRTNSSASATAARAPSHASISAPAGRFHVSHAHASHKREQSPCVLMISAIRNSAAPNVRKTQRHVLAFGARVPPEIEEVRDFEIPEWVHASEWSRHGSVVSDEFPHHLENESGDIEPGDYQDQNGAHAEGEEDVKRESTVSSNGGPFIADDDVVQIAVLE